MAKEILIEDIRLSWTFLDKKDENDKYRATLLFDKKKHKNAYNDILDAVDDLVEDGIKNLADWKGKRPKKVLEFKDGDESEYDYEAGHWLLTASNKNEVPMVLQDNTKDAEAPKDIYSGVYANVIVRVYAMEGKYPGVYVSLEAIQKVRDGEKLGGGGGGVNAKKAFKNIQTDEDRDFRRRDRDEDSRESRRRDDDDEPPRRRRDDRDDEPPRRRRDDRDDEPRSRREEEPPRRRSRDDDDEPPKRRSRDDDDEYDRGRERGRERF